jgi:hypothetical protein
MDMDLINHPERLLLDSRVGEVGFSRIYRGESLTHWRDGSH